MMGLEPKGESPVIDFYASEYYYVDHMASIWHALPEAARGRWWTTEKAAFRLGYYGLPKDSAVVRKGKKELTSALVLAGRAPTLSASYGDWKQVRAASLPAPYLPHGQGGAGYAVEQTWQKHAHELPCMFVAAERGKLPGLNCLVLDGQPKVDRWLGHVPDNEKPTIAISFRWRESTCALDHYRSHMARFLDIANANGWEVWGHGHPLAWEKKFKPFWKSLRCKYTADFEKVQRLADVYCADASSTSFEFMATGRPVVFLDSPIYDEENRRQAMWHRFSHAYGGVTCDDPANLAHFVDRALRDENGQKALREACVRDIFGANDGGSSNRAAAHLVEMFC